MKATSRRARRKQHAGRKNMTKAGENESKTVKKNQRHGQIGSMHTGKRQLDIHVICRSYFEEAI